MKLFFGLYVLFFVLNFQSPIYCQWISQNGGTGQQELSIYFLNENTGFITGSEGKILKTTNGGLNWTIKDSLHYGMYSCNFLNMNTGIIACRNSVLVKTIDGGENWSTNSSSLYHYITDVQYSSINTVWFSSATNIVKSTDGGANWIEVLETSDKFFYSFFFINDMTGWAPCSTPQAYNCVVFKTTNGGINWISYELPAKSTEVWDSQFLDSQTGWLAMDSGKVLKTTNGGINWTVSRMNTINNTRIAAISFPNFNTGYAISDFGKIFKSTNGGTNWFALVSGTNADLYNVFFINNTGWVVGLNGLILKTTNGGVGIQQISTSLPDKFYLEQNYPNPFNPNTNIEFSLPQKSFVKLKVFAMVGKEVANLVNENLSAGSYKYDFNASLLPSGVYFYKLETENFSETRKMVLVK